MGPFTGRPRDTLAAHGNGVAALLFECLNEASDVMARAKQREDDPLILKAIATTAGVAKDVLEFAIGRTTKVNLSIKSQEDLPDYPGTVRDLPPQLAGKLDDLLDEWMQRKVVTTTALPVSRA